MSGGRRSHDYEGVSVLHCQITPPGIYQAFTMRNSMAYVCGTNIKVE